MNTWYFNIKGKGEANSERDYPFGFYVNCLLTTKMGIEEAKSYIENDLKVDGRDIVKFEYSGKYKDFYWDKDHQKKIDKLANKAEKDPEVIYYDSFHTWKKLRKNMWYFGIEGDSEGNKERNYPFGFKVHCLLSTNKTIEEAKNYVANDLKQGKLNVLEFVYSGHYEDFEWGDEEQERELNELAVEAEDDPDVTYYDTFFTWKKKRKSI